MNRSLTLTTSLLAIIMTACATPPGATGQQADVNPAADARKERVMTALSAFTGDYNVSDAAMATAVLDASGKPVGLLAYATPIDAVKAGDMAAFVAAVRTGSLDDDVSNEFASIVTSVDAAAAGQPQLAIDLLQPALETDATADMANFLNAWYLALDGQDDQAIDTLRRVAGRLPGLTGDLSLTSMLEALGRDDQALAIYQTITPSKITAPEHDFDPQGLVYGHVRIVIARQALLLRKLGRIEEAQALYTRLADAEPEQATQFAAAIDSLRTGKGLDDDDLTVNQAFSQSSPCPISASSARPSWATATMGLTRQRQPSTSSPC